MKRLVIGAVLAVSALVSGTASADIMECVRSDGSQHRVYTSNTKVQFNTTVFTFVKTGTLEGGTEVYVFQGNKAGKMLTMAQSSDGVVYQIRGSNLQILEEGLCK